MSAPRTSVLILGSEPWLASIVAPSLRTEDTSVALAPSAEEALNLLAVRPAEVLVLDDRAALGPGGAARLLVRAKEIAPDLRALLLAAQPDAELLLAALDGGLPCRCLKKPCEPADVVAAVHAALDAARTAAESSGALAVLRRRAEALTILSGVAAEAARVRSSAELAGLIARSLPRLVGFDVAAVLVAAGAPLDAAMQVHLASPVGQTVLTRARDRAVEAYGRAAGQPLAEGSLLVTVSGTPSASDEPAPPATAVLELPLRAEERVLGLVHLLAFPPRTFSAADRALLDALAEQMSACALRLAVCAGEEQRKMARVIESMADGVLMTDARSEVILANEAARRLLQIPAGIAVTARYLKDSLGFYPFELVRGGASRGAPLVREEVKILDKHLHSVVTPVLDAAGAMAGVVVALRDITEQKRIEERKAELVAIVSHELRTPLTSITGALDIVLGTYGQGLSEKQRRYIEMARAGCGKLNLIVDDLVDAAGNDGGRLPLRFATVDLSALAKAAIERIRPAAEERRIRLTLGGDAANAGEPRGAACGSRESNLRIFGDPDRLAQVLDNLLSNAVKFTAERGLIEVDLFRPPATGGYVGLSVWNDGEAIPAEARERVFDTFEQVKSSATRRVGGTGLGLAISRGIVEAHGGRIWVEPTEAGTRFVLTLPVAPAEPEQDAEPGFTEERADGELRAPAGSAAKSGRILVVDDDRPTAYVLKGMLLASGHEVLVAHDTDDALVRARSQRPDLITVDLRMPGVDGFALVEILKHDPETHAIPVVVVSVAPDRERATRAGADACLGKPIDMPLFLSSVDRLLAERGSGRRSKILVVDDESGIRLICREILEGAGYVVREAGDGESAVAEAERFRPDLVLLDVAMPGMDGFEAARRLRADPGSALTPILFVSARSQTADKVRAFKLGADDYLVKPFDVAELLARVEKAVVRRERELGASPTTRLPGSAQIEQEIERRLRQVDSEGRGGETASDADFAFCYLDLDNLKAFNDYYGYAKADGIIRQTGDLVRDVVAREGGPGDFIGHIAGDDFVFITTAERVDRVCLAICEAFDRLIPLYYNKADRERGHIEATDRYGELRKFPVMSVSIAALTHGGGGFATYAELASRAAEAKKLAKSLPGSSYVRDSAVIRPSPTARTASA